MCGFECSACCVSSEQRPPHARVVAQNHPLKVRVGVRGIDRAVLVNNGCAHLGSALGVGMAGQRAGPGDVAVAGRVVSVAAFTEDPFAADKGFAQRQVIGGDVRLASRETLFGGGELVHQREAKILLFGSEVKGSK
jgi:hypothetical protein